MPRSKYVKEGKDAVYHCYSRCVRRAFLYGFDTRTQRDFSHRKVWLVNRLQQLAAIFAIEVCAYAIMDNHYHLILRIRPDIAASWSNQEVAARWLTLFPKRCGLLRGTAIRPVEEQIRTVAHCTERIETLRQRLCSLSWFMGRFNEFIARAANKEDDVKGRFWESRFKCQVLLDDAAIAACMVYVDLNPLRAGQARAPEDSSFTSIQERIRAWREEMRTTASVDTKAIQRIPLDSQSREKLKPEDIGELPKCVSKGVLATGNSSSWLCPITSEKHRRGILPMTAAEYFDLVDKSARVIRFDKRGVIESDLAPILIRIGAKPEAWSETVSRFGTKFHLVAGLLTNIRKFADQLGRQWFTGIATARTAFASSPPQFA